MKMRLLSLILAVLVCVSMTALTSCGEEKKADDTTVEDVVETTAAEETTDPATDEEVENVVITVSSEEYELAEGETLADYMTAMKEDGKLDFAIDSGFVTSINGVENPADFSHCWMLYTSDADMASTEWGTTEYEGEELGSAVVGAGELTVVDGATYVWVFEPIVME